MPELIIKFNLPEETEAADIAMGASGMHNAVWNFLQDLRSKIKHGECSKKEYELLEGMRDFLVKELEDNGVLKLF